MAGMKLTHDARCRLLQLAAERRHHGGHCVSGGYAALLGPGIADVPDQVGQEHASGFGLLMALSIEEADVQGAVKASLRDPGAEHLDRAFIALGSGRDHQGSHG